MLGFSSFWDTSISYFIHPNGSPLQPVLCWAVLPHRFFRDANVGILTNRTRLLVASLSLPSWDSSWEQAPSISCWSMSHGLCVSQC